MSKALKISRTKSEGLYKRSNPEIRIALPNKLFDYDYFFISPDHTQITFFPEKCFKNELHLWLVVDSTHVMGANADEKKTFDLKEISSVSCREDVGDPYGTYFRYEFNDARLSDYLKIVLGAMANYHRQIVADSPMNEIKSFFHFVRYLGFYIAFGCAFWLPFVLLFKPHLKMLNNLHISAMLIAIAAGLITTVFAHLYINRKK